MQSSPAPPRALGLACAERFLAEGARVVLSDVNADKLRASGNRLGAEFVVADASLNDVDLLIRRTIEIYGRIDILVSNAGVTSLAEFLDVTEEEFDRVLRINLKSQFLCGQAAAQEMVRQGKGGVIINMSSVNAVLAIANQVPYVVSKGGGAAHQGDGNLARAARHPCCGDRTGHDPYRYGARQRAQQ